jgi:hypothetical protein
MCPIVVIYFVTYDTSHGNDRSRIETDLGVKRQSE